MINADRDGLTRCGGCGVSHHFAYPCPRCSRFASSPGGAVIQAASVPVGAPDRIARVAEADHARTAASGQRTPPVGGWEGGS